MNNTQVAADIARHSSELYTGWLFYISYMAGLMSLAIAIKKHFPVMPHIILFITSVIGYITDEPFLYRVNNGGFEIQPGIGLFLFAVNILSCIISALSWTRAI